GLQGIAYLHSDLGGFAGGEVFDPELYTRWLQYGVFQPVFRPHAQEHIAPEPVFHDEKTKALARQSIRLRYSLLPYIYTLAFENNQTGMPFMRPLFFEEPENESLYLNDSTYLFGNAFLVSPVVVKGQKSKSVYFPKGNNWYDFFEDTQFEGGQIHKIKLKEDHIPVFVRGGSIIPMVEPVMNTDQYSTQKLILHYFADPTVVSGSGKLYDDDGKTPHAFEKGLAELILMNAGNSAEKIELSMQGEPGPLSAASEREITLIVHNLNKEPQMVRDGKFEIPFVYYKNEKKLEATFSYNPGSKFTVEIVK
ncbi:MAG: DUF5110 domain-containing protein, partial [Bacteroidales bacterium]|nr:DUF5110 domain-containing protein [Bacteroidales bacterium]